MLVKLTSWKNDDKSVSIGLSHSDIDKLICNLKRLKNDKSEHFHIINCEDSDIEEITIYANSGDSINNMAITS